MGRGVIPCSAWRRWGSECGETRREPDEPRWTQIEMHPSLRSGLIWIIRGVLCSLSLCAETPGQPASTSELASLERRAAEKSASAREREQAADRAIEVRRKLIDGAKEDDPELVRWLVEQGAALLARASRDGSDSAVLLGIPLPAQQEVVDPGATEAARDLARAAAIAEATHAALEQGGVPPDDVRSQQVEQERGVRIPFYRGRAEALLAACAPEAERAAHATAAIAALEKLALANQGPECARRVTLASALLKRAGAGDARAALEEFAYVATAAGPAGDAPAIPVATRVEGWMGLMHASAALGNIEPALERLRGALVKAPFAPEGKPDPLWIVLAVDAGAAGAVEQAVQSSRPELLERAVTDESSLLAREDLGFGAAALRPLVFEKLAILAGGAQRAGLALPAGMRLARAIMAARDRARRDEALAGFADVATTQAATGGFAADALWEWAVLLTQAGKATPASRLEASRVLTRLAREHAESARATDAIGAALAYARALEGERLEGARGVYLDALTLATTSYEKLPEIDLWRYERARLLAGGAGAGLEDLTTALDQLRRIGIGSRLAEDARRLYERAQVAQFDLLWSRHAEARRRGGDSGARALARGTIQPAADLAADWARTHRSAMLDRFRADEADAMMEAGSPEGRAMYEDLLGRNAPVPGGVARLKLGLGRSLLLAGDRAGAFALIHEAAAALDGPPGAGEGGVGGVGADAGAPARAERFWQAWSILLSLLQEENKDGSRSGTIVAHVKQLEAIDPDLGGEPWKSRIDEARRKASR